MDSARIALAIKEVGAGDGVVMSSPETESESGGALEARKLECQFAKAHDAAADEYGSESRAHRVAYSALKHSFEKVGDRWLPKKKKGPSDARAERGGLHNPIPSAEGVDANASKKHLLDIARRLDISGRSRMDKSQLVDAIMKRNRQVGKG